MPTLVMQEEQSQEVAANLFSTPTKKKSSDEEKAVKMFSKINKDFLTFIHLDDEELSDDNEKSPLSSLKDPAT